VFLEKSKSENLLTFRCTFLRDPYMPNAHCWHTVTLPDAPLDNARPWPAYSIDLLMRNGTALDWQAVWPDALSAHTSRHFLRSSRKSSANWEKP